MASSGEPAVSTARAGWWTRLTTILWFIAALAFLLAAPVLLQAFWLALPLTVLLAAVLSLPIAWLWRRFVTTGRLFTAWLPLSIATSILLAALLAAPVYYLASITQVAPALVPQVTLTNGEKRIVFQGMQHVAASRFFKGVAFDLEDALARGYVLYYEGVAPSTPANDRWFEQVATHGRDLTTAYRELGEVCGLDFQSDYLRVVVNDSLVHPRNHVIADVDTTQLRAEYGRLIASDPKFAAGTAEAADVPDTGGLDRIVGWLRRGTDGQREMAGVLCRGFMTRAMTRSNDAGNRLPLDPLILDYRNRVLSQRLLAEPRRLIYVTYGAKHLPGTFALLRHADPRWRVASVKWLRTIDSPESYSANLPGITD
ncbi:hypothetical protein KZ820_17955 [Sphingomonas sp. RRHST34]|uniref:TraB n=1 Tax=Sphingomonas citri TaxID=2862499 RepID=A0ABS7BSP7_9SPHN|nr:hypothetical protein [Sphingomonas citri]MBW6532630.1 hypothetical protein [Sphingomonas citri]